MKSPLFKRIPRILKEEIGKYLVILIFMTATIGFVSGFLVADNSLIKAYDESFEKYNIEDGNFEAASELDNATIQTIESEQEIKLYQNFYIEEETRGNIDSTLRIFDLNQRGFIDKVCLMKGDYPNSSNEIAVDRMYADNNNININDKITIKDEEFIVTGLVALSDYSALFSDNNDMMFDSVKFGVAIMNDDGFSSLGNTHLHYHYSWLYNHAPDNDNQEKEISEDLLKNISQKTEIKNYIPRYLNQAIQFTGEDMGGDRAMMIVLLYILIAILAFVFAITINSTIVKEASIIGTLRSLGYTRVELLKHYMLLPMLVTLISAILGNILGYSIFKDIGAALYYGSYSLPTYQTIWNSDAFIMTTIVPMIIMLIIDTTVIGKKLRLSPLKFLRHELTSSKRKLSIHLPDIKFIHRFRLRIIFQNISNYITLLIGISFASILLLFGMMMSPILEHYQQMTVDNMFSKYQYVLKAPVEIHQDHTEAYCVNSLSTVNTNHESENITVYGIEKNSQFVHLDNNDKGVYISDGYADKYKIKVGDTITLKENYGEKEYEFIVKDIYSYPGALSVFMDIDDYRFTFDKDEQYFNGYFSNEEIDDINENIIASIITEDDLTKISRQLDVSMGNMFIVLNIFSVVLFAILIYLLTKLIIEKNVTSISMVKILGYQNNEISKIYLLATTWVVIISTLLSLWISTVVISYIYKYIMADFSGWLPLYIKPIIYPEMFAMTMVAYLFVVMMQFRKIKKISLNEALKNVE